jgi:hypothetical protein
LKLLISYLKKRDGASSDTNPYFEEVHAIYESDAKTLLDFKKEKLLKKEDLLHYDRS